MPNAYTIKKKHRNADRKVKKEIDQNNEIDSCTYIYVKTNGCES